MALCDRLAVIDDGRILQIGPPEEPSQRPNCAFVASFLGGVTLLPGRVATGAEGTVFTADEVTLRVAAADAPDPHLAAILIRPEDAEPPEHYPFNRLVGQVASCSFLGRCWRLAVSVAGRDFRLDWHERVRAGESFAFSVAPERCTIVPADGVSPAAQGPVRRSAAPCATPPY